MNITKYLSITVNDTQISLLKVKVCLSSDVKVYSQSRTSHFCNRQSNGEINTKIFFA